MEFERLDNKRGFIEELANKLLTQQSVVKTYTYVFCFQDKDPIKVLDLENCIEVAKDDSQGKANCFRLVNKTHVSCPLPPPCPFIPLKTTTIPTTTNKQTMTMTNDV